MKNFFLLNFRILSIKDCLLIRVKYYSFFNFFFFFVNEKKKKIFFQYSKYCKMKKISFIIF
jgi:hypothetical protein